ncbi:GDSL-type esterase/lipase family protein [Roseibium polysiphoniae]|nr:GDSL-type esterase/lipase family protein [Roseibium polysiphoniae]
MARGVADGLAFTLADKPMVRVETLTEDKSGLAGDNAPDWNARVLAKVRGADVKAVVVTMGREDLGKRFPSEPPIEFGVDGWWSTYEKKVGSLVRTIRQERKPVVWVGLAPTGNALTNTDFVLLNEVFRGQTEAERGYFIDLWDVFLSDAGEYSSYGPDVDGKNLRLRTNDKIGFTWAGYRKVAFFVERQLSRLLGGYGGLAFEGVEDDPDFIVLTGRTTSPEDVLLGGDVDQETGGGETLAHQYFVEGRPLQSVAGRVDNTARISQ